MIKYVGGLEKIFKISGVFLRRSSVFRPDIDIASAARNVLASEAGCGVTMIPNLLTLTRIFSIPFIIACFYVGGFFSHLIATVLFVIACLTDFFDGYFARHLKQGSSLGRFLDPIADKLLVSTILLMLSGTGVISGVHLIAAVIILAREIMVSGLRQFMAEIRVHVPVTRYAKWKTAMQMSAISSLLISAMFPEMPTLRQVGIFLLWIAVIMTVFTGARYLRFGIMKMDKEASGIKNR